MKMPPQHWRHLWRNTPRLGNYTFWWDIISHDSYVVITAAEADLTAATPGRFIGNARPVIAGSIAPQDGFVLFTLWWYGDFPYLNIWTDITVFDRDDPSGTN
jgi:hypothetical protein